jgi:hypothetical protein
MQGSDLQNEVDSFIRACFGDDAAADKTERNHRFLEESLELVQSLGCTKEEALMLVEYVFDRPVGEAGQEVGGVMLTLAGLCNANYFDMSRCAEMEMNRVYRKFSEIQEKQANKPENSPLPQ